MSWFRLILAEKPILESSVFSFNFRNRASIYETLKNKMLMQNSYYLRIKAAAAEFFREHSMRRIAPLNHDMLYQALKKALKHEKFNALVPELYSHYKERTAQKDHKHHHHHDDILILREYFKQSPERSNPDLHSIANMLFDHFLLDDTLKMTRSFGKDLDDKLFLAIIKMSLHKNLLPACEKAMHTSIQALWQTSFSEIFDYTTHKVLAIAIIPAVYHLAIDLFSKMHASELFPGLQRPFKIALDNLPHSTTIFAVITSAHLTKMAHVFWKIKRNKHPHPNIDKQQVKDLACRLAKDPIRHALSAHDTTTPIKDSKLDELINLLITEIVDFYWKDLQQIKLLDLPLVI